MFKLSLLIVVLIILSFFHIPVSCSSFCDLQARSNLVFVYVSFRKSVLEASFNGSVVLITITFNLSRSSSVLSVIFGKH